MIDKVILLLAMATFATAVQSFEDVDDEICIGLSTGVTVSVADNCNYYYSCFDQLALLQNCGADFVYDARTNNCVFSSEIDCTTRSDADVDVKYDNNLVSTDCMGYIDRHLLRARGSCTKFHVCQNEAGFIDDCAKFGPNFYFESSSGNCVEGAQYNCINGNVVHLVSRISFEKIKVSPPDYDLSLCRGYEDGNIFGIQGSCKFYYFCADQVGYLQNCLSYGEDFQFDTNKNDCSNKSTARCHERMDILK
jgi:hypothetical protein